MNGQKYLVKNCKNENNSQFYLYIRNMKKFIFKQYR